MTDPARPVLSRRALIAGGAALAALPAGRVLGQQNEPDVAIIGAGVAGIAAARRIAEAGRSYVLLEASGRVGGRTVTDTAAFGVPFDLGAGRLNMPAARPLAAFGRAGELDVFPAPQGGRLYLRGREANDAEYEDFVGTVRRAQRAIAAAGDAGRDLPASRVLSDLGPWSDSARFVVGPLACAKELEQVSTVDASRAAEPDGEEVCRQGIGTLVAHIALPLAVRLDTPVRAIELGGRQAVIQTARGNLLARAVIVCVPPSVILAGKLRILPGLAPRYRTAIEKITLGAFDHIAFRLPGNPVGLAADERIHFRTGAGGGYALRARIAGTDLYTLDVAGDTAARLADAGADAATSFLRDALTREFGADLAAKVGKVQATRWTKEPWSLGAFSCALPGFGNMRRAFTEVVQGRLMFAGEHTHETLWGTVGGAWASGERAAKQALALIGARSG